MNGIITGVLFALIAIGVWELIKYLWPRKPGKIKAENIVEPGLFSDLYKITERSSSILRQIKMGIDHVKPIPILYDLEVDNRKCHEINQNIMLLVENTHKYHQALADTEVIKAIVKRRHETFYKNRTGEYWSKPDGIGGYIIYKNGEFFEKPKK